MADEYESAVIASQAEAARWRRFREFAGPDACVDLDASERMRVEFTHHVHVMLTSDEAGERSASASWVARYAAEAAHRTAVVRAMYARFLHLDGQPICVEKRDGGTP